jgi:threonine dehydratase
MPITAPLVKVESCRRNEAHVTLRGNTFAEAYEYAVTYARENGLTYIPPFDHPRIIAGQGTCGLEIVEQLPNIDSVVVPVGGGGLISGIALAIKEQRPDIFILGVRSEWAERAKYDPASLAARRVPPSIADGIAVKDIGNYPREIITRLVDKMVTVTDVEVADAIIRHLELEHSVIEGAAAAGLAALYQRALPEQYKRPCFVICGSNIDPTLLSHLIERNMNGRGRILRLQVSLPDRPGTLHDLSGTVATAGANIVEVHHDRFNSALPGSADVTIVAEVRNSAHAAEVEQAVALAGFTSRRAG